MAILVGTLSGVLAALVVSLLARIWRSSGRAKKAFDLYRDLVVRLEKAGVSNFYASRADYVRYRGAPTLTDYLSTATKTIDVAAYWMAHGNEAENVADAIGRLIEANPGLKATIGIIDPTSDYLGALADYLGIQTSELHNRLAASLSSLQRSRAALGVRARERLQLKVYRTLPVASVIMLDVQEDGGRIQIDVKPYRAPRSQSFGIELAGGELFETCRTAWLALLRSAEDFDPANHLT